MFDTDAEIDDKATLENKLQLMSFGHNPRRMIVGDGQGVMKTEGGYAKQLDYEANQPC